MNPVSGHNTLPLAPRSESMPRSQSSRGSAASKQQRQQHQHAKHFITQTTKGGFTSYMASRVNDLPEDILKDRAIPTSAHEDHRRRTIIVKRDRSQGGSFGFTLQTYGIRHKDDSEIELITYVDSVEPYGPAARAGMRAGDVILSINGQDVESVDHNRLIQMIQACPQAMRIVVLFEDCVRRVALHVKLMQLKHSYQQKIMEYNHFVEAERNMLLTLQNKGVDTQHLVKGSSELLPLSSTSTDVLFPFRKHSKSFNRLSVSHSKSESRLLSDSASNLAGSSSTRGRPIKDTSASCSTLPRLGGRRSSARSLPTSAAVTPVGSLDGLEQGTSHPIPLILPMIPPCRVDDDDDATADDVDKDDGDDDDDDDGPCAGAGGLDVPHAITEAVGEIVEEFSLISEDLLVGSGSSSDALPEPLSPLQSPLPLPLPSPSDAASTERTVAAYESVYDVDLFGLHDRKLHSNSGRDLSESGYLSSSPEPSSSRRRHPSDAALRDPGCCLPFSRLKFPRRPFSQIAGPLAVILDCICCRPFGLDPVEGHEHIMSECSFELDLAMRRVFCALLALCLFILSNNFLSNGSLSVLFTITVMLLGM